MRILAAQPAADAAVEHGGDRVDLERVAAVLDRERRAAREPDARVVARARVLVDAVLDAHAALALALELRAPRLHAPLTLELALAFGDDDLEAGEVGRERLLERRAHLRDVVARHRAHPAHA